MMAAFSHCDCFESRARSLRVAGVSASPVIARRSIDLKDMAGRICAAVIEALLFAWVLLAMAFSFLVFAGFLA
jgi:hypothetical protein